MRGFPGRKVPGMSEVIEDSGRVVPGMREGVEVPGERCPGGKRKRK